MTVSKFCRECGTPTDGAKFCPECGTPTDIAATATMTAGDADETTIVAVDDAASGDAAAGDATTAETPDAEEIEVPLEDDENEVWSGVPDAVMSPLAKRTTKYVITNERIKMTSGVMGRKIESMDLFRVKDIQVKKSLTQRTRGKGDLTITSTDASTPKFTFESIRDPDDVAETLRTLVRDARRRHNVTTHEHM